MALYTGQRDIDLFIKLNKELINRIIDTTVDIFKIVIAETNTSLYGESNNKIYNNPVRVACLITTDGQVWDSTEFGSDINQTITFSFLRDTLKDASDIVVEVGDLIKWNENFWEIDGIVESQFVGGKNPETDHIGGTFGGNHSVICSAQLSRQKKLSITRTNVGNIDLYS